MTHPNPYIDGILWGGNQYGNTITYSFWDDPSLDDNYDIDTTSTPWSDYEIAAMEQALTTWSNVANINFVQAANNAPNATLAFNLVNNTELDNDLGRFYPPGEDGEGNGYFNSQDIGWNEASLQQGGKAFTTLIHELGHGLGLAHPHDTGGGSSIYPGVDAPSDTGVYGLNQGVWTTMSYNKGLVSNDYSGILDYGYQGTPMAFDIAAIQYLYGANTSYNTGDNTYFLPTSNTSGTFYSCIWDADGFDTISAANATADATINLNDAPLTGPNAGGYISSVAGIYGGFTIANGVVIEDAIGGSGNDSIIGNEADNYLSGGSGNDTLNGYGGTTGEYDVLSGDFRFSEPAIQDSSNGADTFVLGDAYGAFYLGEGYATITDFYWAEGDSFQAYGSESDYSLGFQNWSGSSDVDTLIYYQSDLISVVQDTSNVFVSWDFTLV